MDEVEVVARRLFGQHLVGPPLPDPAAVVRHFGAVQAQEFGVAKWSLGQRTAGFDDAAVQRLIDDGAILRTHALRPTWHFVTAEDIGWLQSLTGPRVHRFNAYYNRQHGLDEDLMATAKKSIAGALRGGNHLTRRELGAVLAGSGIEATGNRLAYVIMWAELDGLIANGPMRGKQHTYALIDERVPRPRLLDPDEALAELTIRYFSSHGPATIKDFAWWSSLTVAEIKRGLALAGSALASEGPYWFAPAKPPPLPSPTASILQIYDEFVVAYTESRGVSNLADRPIAGLNDIPLAQTVLLDGQRVGTFRRVVQRHRIVAEVALAISLTAGQRRAVEAEFARYADFAGVPVVVEWPDR